MLRQSTGTVTELIEAATGEPLRAEVLRRETVTATVDDGLGDVPGQPRCQRVAVLRGSESEVAYLYAESVFVAERLPGSARRQLEGTDDPIGRVLVAHGLRLATEPLAPPAPSSPAPALTASGGDDVVWARAYLLLVDGTPVFAIREWFFRPVLDALARPAAARTAAARPPRPRAQ
jgi:chorismate-pyruvate lyase